MQEYDLTKIVRALMIKEAISKAHDRLRDDLKAWAISKEFTIESLEFPKDCIPDVLLAKTDNLFIGDAKVSDNEPPSKSATVQRILKYITEFSSLLGKKYKGGIFAIATDDEKVGKDWIPVLNNLFKGAGITDSSGGDPAFKIERISAKDTFIIWW